MQQCIVLGIVSISRLPQRPSLSLQGSLKVQSRAQLCVTKTSCWQWGQHLPARCHGDAPAVALSKHKVGNSSRPGRGAQLPSELSPLLSCCCPCSQHCHTPSDMLHAMPQCGPVWHTCVSHADGDSKAQGAVRTMHDVSCCSTQDRQAQLTACTSSCCPREALQKPEYWTLNPEPQSLPRLSWPADRQAQHHMRFLLLSP